MTVDTDYFLDRVEIDENCCWIWQLFVKPNGYGQIGRNGYAHRASYEVFVGAIPEGLEIDHTCGNKRCVNPEHLEAVTHGENNKRGWARRGYPLHCKRGHLMTGSNIRWQKRGKARECRTCRNERRMRRYYAAKTPQTLGDLDDGGAS